MPPAVRQDEDLVLDDDYQSDSNVGGLQATPPEDDNVYSSTDDHDRGVEDILNTMEQLESNASNHEDENEDDPESEEEEQRPQRGQREAEQPSQNLDSLRKFWETLPPTLLELSLGNIETPSACLTPRDDDEKRMYSLSKCFKTIPKDSKRHLAQLTDGSSLVFMAQCHTEIPVHIQEVLWFFSNVRNSITDLSNYCLPTTTVTLHKSRISGRGVAGLVTNMEPEPPVRRARPRNTGFVVMADFLGERALHQGKDTKTPVQPIKIHVGFTGATFENQGQEVRETFCFAIITPAGNFDMWGYIYEVFLKQPSRGDKNFKELSEEFKRHSYILRKILRTEAFVNLGMDEHVDGNPETHRFTPSSSLGSITMLNMYQIPCKIFHLVHKKYPESKNLRIMNMPNIQFRHGDENTSKWLKHMNTFINEAARYDVSMRLAMEQYWAAKDKDRSTMPDFQALFMGAWPLQIDPDMGTIVKHGLPPLPLMHEFVLDDLVCPFPVWLSNIGGADGLPDLTRGLIRAYLSKTCPLDVFPNIMHFMTDVREANPMLWLQKYFSSDADPLKALMIDGRLKHWHVAVSLDMAQKRKDGVSVDEVLDMLESYVQSAVHSVESMMESGVFRSKTLMQALEICRRVDWAKACQGEANSVKATVKRFSDQISASRQHDSVAVALKSMWRMWEYVNSFFFMNSGNMVFAIETFLSQLMFRFGDNNQTWSFFFVSVMVISGNGHFMVNSSDGPHPDARKPNSTGFDWAKARLTDVVKTLYEIIGVTERRQMLELLLDCMRWTETSFENLTTATMTMGNIETIPDEEMADRPLSAPEIRGQTKKALIQHVCNRGEQSNDQVNANTCDKNKNGLRTFVARIRVGRAPLACLSSNLPDEDRKAAEETKSLMVVTPCLPPGSAPQPKKRKADGSVNGFNADMFSSRQRSIANKEMVAWFLPFSHTLSGVYCGLLNRLGALNFEISDAVAGYTEWCHIMIKHWCGGMFDTIVLESYSRMKDGYQSRGVVLSIWVQTIAQMAKGKEKYETIRNLLLALQVHPMPIVMVPVAMTCLLTRAVHMGSLLITNVVARHLDVPVVTWEGLRSFYSNDPVPTEGVMLDDYLQIKHFVQACIVNNRFAPERHGPVDRLHNISCYVSSNGTPEQRVAQPKKDMLRVTDGKSSWDKEEEIIKAVANQIKDQVGGVLFNSCHMGPEVCVIKNALDYLMHKFRPDLRGLCSPNLFASMHHLVKLGLETQIPGLQDVDDDDVMPYARTAVFMVNGEARSAGLAVNIWSLLAIVSLVRNKDLSPHVSNDMARALMEKLLNSSPATCTPGNHMAVRSFNPMNMKNEEIVLSNERRPEHFLRPESASFGFNGVLPLAKRVDDTPFLPEDLMHAAFLPSLAGILHCKIKELPARAIKAQYELMPGRHYTMHKPGPGKVSGWITVNTASKKVEYYMDDQTDAPKGGEWGFDNWQDELSASGYVLTPMIWRSGACVKISMPGDKAIPGVVVGIPDTTSRFDKTAFTYRVLVRRPHESQTSINGDDPETVNIHFLDALDALVPVGDELYLDMEDMADEGWRQVGKWLKVRLNVPPMAEPEDGKLFVTALYYNRPFGRPEVASLPSLTISVDPWSLCFPSNYDGSPEDILDYLHKPRGAI